MRGCAFAEGARVRCLNGVLTMTENSREEVPVHLDLEKLHGFRHLAKMSDATPSLEQRADAIFNKIGELPPAPRLVKSK